MLGRLLLISSLLFAPISFAQQPARMTATPNVPTLHLDAEASEEIANDQLTATLFIERDGADAAAISQQINAALADGIKRLKSATVEVKNGGYNIYPTNNQKGKITGWRGRGELIVETKDFAEVGKLLGKLDTLQVAGMYFSLTRAKQREVELTLMPAAVKDLRDKAEKMTKALGYNNYAFVDVSVNQARATPPQPMMRSMKVEMMAAGDAMPVPTEGGKSRVSVTVNAVLSMN